MKILILLKIIIKKVWFATIVFFNHGFKFQNSVCNGCHDLTMLSLNISDISITAIKGVDSCCIIHGISKAEATRLLENCELDDCGYT